MVAKSKCRFLSITVALSAYIFASVLPAVAESISSDEACVRVAAWLRSGAKKSGMRLAAGGNAPNALAHRMRPAAAPSGFVRTCERNGTNLFHLVELEGGGFVAVAAEDATFPIIGFSATDELPDVSREGPFYALVAGAAAENCRNTASVRVASTANPIQSASSIDDLRVAPLVESKWDQKDVVGKKVYNYYTPNGFYCGCVATAMAQIMRFHRYPETAVAPQVFSCSTNGLPVELEMKGGAYDWDNMPLVPSSAITDAQREAIGRICYDAGVAMHMDYAKGGSAAAPVISHEILKNVFGYASAESYFPEDGSISEEIVEKAILANIDAGYPVMLGIWEGESGHAVLADGYGFVDDVLYCHLNMGWSGISDFWFALPQIDAGVYHFNEVGVVVYNIFPDSEGELVTGRVFDPFGAPLANVQVTANMTLTNRTYRQVRSIQTWRDSFAGMETQTTRTTSTGHYAILVPPCLSATAIPVGQSDIWISTNSVTANVLTNSSPFDINLETGNWFIADVGVQCGNSWGNDLYLAPQQIEPPLITDFSFGDDGGEISFTGTPGAACEIEYILSLSPASWQPYASMLMPIDSEKTIRLAPIPNAPSAFFRITSH